MSQAAAPGSTKHTVTRASSISSSLLTAPLTPIVEHDMPYKPSASDHTSLTQKKKKHKHKNTHKRRDKAVIHNEIVSSNGLVGTRRKEDPFSGSCSPGSRSNVTVHRHDTIATSFYKGSRDDLRLSKDKSRRWTLPSKSTTTRAIIEVQSTVEHTSLQARQDSPAMITLRRATTNKSRKMTGITFFPEPKFESQSPSLLTYLISTLARASVDTTEPSVLGSDRYKAGSVGSRSDTAPTGSVAPTVCTEVLTEHDKPGSEERLISMPMRRCSTKYVSNSNTYEIIWDENDSLTSSSSEVACSPIAKADTQRRRSMAVEQLESALARIEDESRQSSRQSSSRGSHSSIGTMLDHRLLRQKLSQTFAHLTGEAALKNLPRSRWNMKENPRLIINTSSDEVYHKVEDEHSKLSDTTSVELFPPLSSLAVGSVHQSFSLRKRNTLPLQMTGHERQNSTDTNNNGFREPCVEVANDSRCSSRLARSLLDESDGYITAASDGDVDSTPLLDKSKKRGSRFQKSLFSIARKFSI